MVTSLLGSLELVHNSTVFIRKTVGGTLCGGLLFAACADDGTPRSPSDASVDAAVELADVGVTNTSGSYTLDPSTYEDESTQRSRDSHGGTTSRFVADSGASVSRERDSGTALSEARTSETPTTLSESATSELDAATSEAPTGTTDHLDASPHFADASDAHVMVSSTAHETDAVTQTTRTSASVNTASTASASQDAGDGNVDSSLGSQDAGRPKDASLDPVTHASCPVGPYVASPIPNSLEFQPLCSGLTFTEGPVWVAAESRLYFSDFDNGAASTNFNGDILRYTPEESCAVWLADVGSNGLALGNEGELVACRHTTQTVTAYDRQTQAGTPLALSYQGSNFSSPNDLAVRSDGNLYFSDPAWNLGNRTQELPQAVYRINPGGAVSLIEELPDRRPNGVALSPDETVLYVALSNEIRRYDLDPFGAASNPRTFVNVGSDGLAVDCAGNVYVTTGGIRIYAPNEDLIGSLGAFGNVTNLAFGGADGRTLFVTGGSALRSIELAIPGLPN